MLKQLAEYEKFVEINGFSKSGIGDAKALLESIRKDLPEGVEAQLFNADLVATWQHLCFAALNALQAFKSRRNLSKTLATETVLYASAQRQIKKAIEFIGVKTDSKAVAVLLLGADVDSVEAGLLVVTKRLKVEPDENVLALFENKFNKIKSVFDVSEAELEAVSVKFNTEKALVDLIIERVALLSTRL